jgi:hypothetical protein
LFDSLYDAAQKTVAALKPVVVEADATAYKPESPAAPANDPYGRAETDVDQVPAASVDAYESEYYGYGTTDYLRDNYGYTPVAQPQDAATPAVENDVERHDTGDSLPTAVKRWASGAANSKLLQSGLEAARDAQSQVAELAGKVSLKSLSEASELAWDRLEEHRRLNVPAPQTEQAKEIEYRMPGDDCGWECHYGLAKGSLTPAPVAARQSNREAVLTLARGLRALADRLEAASDWLADLGEVDVAELEGAASPR